MSPSSIELLEKVSQVDQQQANEMDAILSPPKVLLLAAQLSSTAQIRDLTDIAQRYPDILQPKLLLRILLTYLPETTKPSHYLPLLQLISNWEDRPNLNTNNIINTSCIDSLSDEEASRQSKRLGLLPLSLDGYAYNGASDDLLAFLVLRTHRIDSETGILSMILDLLHPFESLSKSFNDWVAGTVRPFVRRYSDYYSDEISRPSLFEFERLPENYVVSQLLGRALSVDASDRLHRDIQTILLPWISSEKRWSGSLQGYTSSNLHLRCAAWEHFLELFLSWSSSSWATFVMTARRWRGAQPSGTTETSNMQLSDAQYAYLDDTWSRAIMAGLYSASDASLDTLSGAYDVCQRLGTAMGLSISSSLSLYIETPEHINPVTLSASHGSALLSSLRNNLLHPSNILTTPTEQSISLLLHLIGSAFIFNTFSQSISIRRAADLYLSQDVREQRSDLTKLMRGIGGQGRDDDEYWQQARSCLQWLRSWNAENDSEYDGHGILGRIHEAEVETEFLKSLLEKSKFEFARMIYHTGSQMPLSVDDARNVVYNAALHAFDNAPNPNRNRGGLKHCNDIIYSLPGVLDRTMPQTIEVEALLSAAHALGTYRIVLKQGEPFSPVVLRVHSDPIAIIEKALEQNPRAYTRLQEFIEIGANLVKAGIASRQHAPSVSHNLGSRLNNIQTSFVTERRVVGLCIEAALREDDFETAYSYVLSRLTVRPRAATEIEHDPWSWAAALQAGQYMRTEKSQLPTHLGTASGNLAIRHLQHRMECLATALLIAPSSELQSVLKAFRRCEEQLDSAIKEEEANEAAWDANADISSLPGAFEVVKDNSRAARHSAFVSTAFRGDDSPMSLFDLSRATAKIAQRNLTALSTDNVSSVNTAAAPSAQDLSSAQRPRKRDQLRDAATGTLVSGVGWLIGANPVQSNNGGD